MKVQRVGISNYRSIGDEFIFVDLTRKLNILVGTNNCGKSNVLRSLQSIKGNNSMRPAPGEIDKHRRKAKAAACFRFEILTEEGDEGSLQELKKLSIDWTFVGNQAVPIRSSFDGLTLKQFNRFKEEMHGKTLAIGTNAEQLEDQKRELVSEILHNPRAEFPNVFIVPQFRQIRDQQEYSLDGGGVIKLLAAWQHPEIGLEAASERFEKVQSLLRMLLEMPSVCLEVSHKQDQIIVANAGLRLPLDSYGTGIHELIILAIAVLSKDNSIFCIEEPEIHLHPNLQKRFLDFLKRETNNRFIITTHSPSFISPAEDTLVTHLWLEDGVTKSRALETTTDSLRVLHDLGIQPSDLLQANAVIWVEGPSDRIYLNRWLALIEPGLREGVDYSVMFYGGRLLSHVSMEREDPSKEAKDLVKLVRINQHSAILIDSDRSTGSREVNKTKQRVQSECQTSGALCWITDGREIENYLPTEAIQAAYSELTGTQLKLSFRKYDRLEQCLKKAFGESWKTSFSYDGAKPDMARRITQHIVTDHLSAELKSWLGKLVAVIRREHLDPSGENQAHQP